MWSKSDFRREISFFINDDSCKWKEVAARASFFLFEEDQIEEEIKLDFMLLTWDIIFPEETWSKLDFQDLTLWMIENVSTLEWCSFDDLIDSNAILFQSDERLVNYYLILKTYQDFAYPGFYLRHEIGSVDWYFKQKKANLETEQKNMLKEKWLFFRGYKPNREKTLNIKILQNSRSQRIF